MTKPFDTSELTGQTILIDGMPIWNAYFTDLTGDDFPEICATYTWGSGVIDSRVVICDYANGAIYELSDRGPRNGPWRKRYYPRCLFRQNKAC